MASNTSLSGNLIHLHIFSKISLKYYFLKQKSRTPLEGVIYPSRSGALFANRYCDIVKGTIVNKKKRGTIKVPFDKRKARKAGP